VDLAEAAAGRGAMDFAAVRRRDGRPMDDPQHWHPVLLGFLGSLAAGLGTAVGALGIFAVRELTDRARAMLLASAAGIMLAATVFSLLLPGFELATAMWGGKGAGMALVAVGTLVGALAVRVLDDLVPHEHFVAGREGASAAELARIWLFVIAIAIHNLPEGLAVGVAFGGDSGFQGSTLALGIGLQNVPEGLAVAVSLVSVGYRRRVACAWACGTGLIEPLAGALGAAAVWLAEPLLPFALTFAAGAMLFVVSDEIIPETHRRGEQTNATMALVCGFLAMMGLDVLLG
jgi:ZIP family zinc transporter